MTGTLVIGEIDAGGLSEASAELVSAAVSLGRPVTLAVGSADPQSVSAIDLRGIDRLIGLPVPGDPQAHEVRERAVETLIDLTQPATVLLSANWDNAAFAAGLAERRRFSFATDVIEISSEPDGALVVTRPAYGGKVNVKLRIDDEGPSIVLPRAGVWTPAESSGQAVPMEVVGEAVSEDSRVRRIDLLESGAGDAELARAEVIFGLGRGVGKPEHIAVFEDIARQLGVALGASRPLVDVGLVDRHKQIGQSGVTVKPRLYVAFGISGSMQHMAGISESRMIFAVNTDEEAPIFDAAHLGTHVDAMEVAKHLLSSD
ncbi:electron transfer flavoprotein subunit alpha/FixB family protein [Elongatibacter sediminis]|uniref:Electron transfer flavoprotein subunit alpha/FixB family protein n=1 Tax=Elongatibacter sediminis TaxID=3119006 RepID=A0AAW9RHY2_9GAMM